MTRHPAKTLDNDNARAQDHPMNETKSLSQIGTEASYPGDIVADVEMLRSDGKSWRQVADAISAALPDTITVSHESLRAWYGKVVAA